MIDLEKTLNDFGVSVEKVPYPPTLVDLEVVDLIRLAPQASMYILQLQGLVLQWGEWLGGVAAVLEKCQALARSDMVEDEARTFIEKWEGRLNNASDGDQTT